MPKLPRRLWAAAKDLERRLQHEIGWIVDVRPLVVIWADFPSGEAAVLGVQVIRGDRLNAWLLGQPNRLSEEDQERVRAAVDAQPGAVEMEADLAH